jgi:hypothetical protein
MRQELNIIDEKAGTKGKGETDTFAYDMPQTMPQEERETIQPQSFYDMMNGAQLRDGDGMISPRSEVSLRMAGDSTPKEQEEEHDLEANTIQQPSPKKEEEEEKTPAKPVEPVEPEVHVMLSVPVLQPRNGASSAKATNSNQVSPIQTLPVAKG